MNTAVSVTISKKALSLSRKEAAAPPNWLLIILVGLIVLTLGMQVLMSVKTEALRQRTQILLNEATYLKNKNLELATQLSLKFNPQVVEKFARERLNMEFAIIAPQTSVVFLDYKDVQALAAVEAPVNNGTTIP